MLWQLIRLMLLALSIVVLARLLQPKDYGLLAMVTAIIGIGELLRDLGLSVAAIQSKTLSREEKSNLFWVNTLIGFVLTAIVFVCAQPLAAIYGEPKLVPITQALSLTFLLNGVATQFKAQITRDLRFMSLGVAEAVPQAVGLAVAIWIAISVGDYRALVAQALTISVLALLLDVALARWRPGFPSRSTSIRRFLRFGGALAGTQGLAYLSKNIDTVALGLLFGSTPLGFYNRAYQIVVLPLTQMTAPLTRVAIPVLSKVQDDDKEFVKFLRTGQFFSVLVSSIFFGSVIGLGRPLVEVVLGPDWGPSVMILQVLAVSGIFRVLGQVPYWIFVAKGLAGTQFRFYLVAQPLVAISILCGLPWGPVGVAAGGVVGYALFWGLQMWWAGRQTTINTLELVWSGLAIASSVAGPLALIGWFLSWQVTNSWLAVILGLASTIVYIGVLVLVMPSYRAHLKTVRRLMNRRNK